MTISQAMSMSPGAAAEFVERHRETLERAGRAIRERTFWSPFPESPKAYGDEAPGRGRQAFERRLGQSFELDQPTTGEPVTGETSPYGIELGISYPAPDIDALISGACEALPAWRDAGPDIRTGVCLEIVSRLNQRVHEMAYAVMHTTGQAFPMAFQAGGTHAQDRAVEAIAYGHLAQTFHAPTAVWEKPQGKRPPLRMTKRFVPVPRGLGLVIGCSTFPTWNGYPGLFASLVTGNPVLVKPHGASVLPLAITVEVARQVLAEAGFAPALVSLVAEPPAGRLAASLAVRPEVRIIDYTGSTQFGEWLEANARQALVFTEKAGVNPVVIDSTDDYTGMLNNLAFTLCLYSGQMCTTSQNLMVPREGIETDDGRKAPEEVGADLAAAIEKLLADPRRATGLLGAIVDQRVLDRVEAAERDGRVLLASKPVDHPEFPDAVVRTPVLLAAEAGDPATTDEQFGPITYVVTTDSTAHSLELMRDGVRERGAITASVYSTDESVLDAAEQATLDAGVALSCNLTDGVYVNQSTAFSDFHATGANPAANAALTDLGLVGPRFYMVQSRRHLPEVEQS